MTWIELVAVIFGLLAVGLTVRQSLWCWPSGLIQVTLYIFIFYQVKLYSDLVLHVIFVFLQIYGWIHWATGRGDHRQLPVTKMSYGEGAVCFGLATVGSAGWGFLMASYTDAAIPYPDAFIAVASLIAQWLMAQKRLESWLVWIVVDLVAIVVYISKDLYLTAGLYAVFLAMCVAGYRSWRRSWNLDRLKDLKNDDRIGLGEVRASA